jgi:hypothetical protein
MSYFQFICFLRKYCKYKYAVPNRCFVLWSWDVLEKLPIKQYFMEPKGSLPCSQEPYTGPILSQINPVHITPFYSHKINFNIIHPLRSWSSFMVFFLLVFPLTFYIHYCFPHSCCMLCPSYFPSLDPPNYTSRRVQFMKLPIMEFSRNSCHFISFRSKYFPQHPLRKNPQSMFLL